MTKLDIYRSVAVNMLDKTPEQFEKINAMVCAMSPGAIKMLAEEVPPEQLRQVTEDCLTGLSLAMNTPRSVANLKKAMDHLNREYLAENN